MREPEVPAVAEAREALWVEFESFLEEVSFSDDRDEIIQRVRALIDSEVAAVRAEERGAIAELVKTALAFRTANAAAEAVVPITGFEAWEADERADEAMAAMFTALDGVASAGQAYENVQPSLVHEGLESPTQDALAGAPTIKAEANP